MTSSIWQLQSDKTQNWAYMDNLFTPEECAYIISIGNAKLEGALVGLDGRANKGIRESQIAWLYGSDIEFAFRRVTDAILNINNQFFNFDLFGMAEGFQFTRYDAPTGHYGMHIDKILNGAVRKLSLMLVAGPRAAFARIDRSGPEIAASSPPIAFLSVIQ